MALAAQWSASAVTSDTWTLSGQVGDGVSGSFWATRSDGIQAVAKPAYQQGVVPNAAHERIAAELAYRIGVPVPPVQLWDAQQGRGLFAVSAFPFRQPLTWRQAQGILTPTFRQNALPMLATGYVFHAWIADTDHANHDGNLLVDAECTEDAPGVSFIDHAYSLSVGWQPGSAACQPLSTYYAAPSALPPSVIADTVGRIQAVTDQEIAAIVDAVPVAYLPTVTAQIIKQCLSQRRQELPAAFGIATGATP